MHNVESPPSRAKADRAAAARLAPRAVAAQAAHLQRRFPALGSKLRFVAFLLCLAVAAVAMFAPGPLVLLQDFGMLPTDADFITWQLLLLPVVLIMLFVCAGLNPDGSSPKKKTRRSKAGAAAALGPDASGTASPPQFKDPAR